MNARSDQNIDKIAVLASFGMFLDGYQLTVMAFAILLIPTYISMPVIGSGLLIASVIIGAIIGTVTMGYISDILGRRKVYLSTLLFFIILDFISVLSFNFAMLFISRILLGVVIGAEYPVANSYIAEETPSESRGFYLSLASLFFTIGSISSAIIAIFTMSMGNIGWRLMLGLAILPAIAVEFMRLSMPESKMWETKEKRHAKTKFREMFSGKNSGNIIKAALIWFLYDIVAYGLSLTLPTILNLGNFVSNVDNAVLTTVFLIMGVISTVFVMKVIDRTGRKIVQIIGLGAMAVLFLILPHYYFLVAIIILFATLEFFNAFVGTTVGIIPAEVTVTEYRGSSYGFSSMLGKVGAVIGVIAMSILIRGNNYFNTYLFLSVILVIAIILTLLLPETKGKVLE